MSCKYPMLMERRGFTANGKPNWVMLRMASGHDYDKVTDPVFGWKYMIIGCRQCYSCKLARSGEWANRMIFELESQPPEKRDDNWYMTITYNDKHLYYRTVTDDDDAPFGDFPSLEPEGLKNFFKRLRETFPDSQIRYYYCGEYSPVMRPHYHAIVFGLHLEKRDLIWIKDRNARIKVNGKLTNTCIKYYHHPLVDRCWSETSYMKGGNRGERVYDYKGFVTLARVCWRSCAYVARYVTKKLSGPLEEFYYEHGLVPPYSNQSRRPGIGRSWYESHVNYIAQNSELYFGDSDGGRSALVPQYYQRLFEIDTGQPLPWLDDVKRATVQRYKKLLNDHEGQSLLSLLQEEANTQEKLIKSRLARRLV